MRLARRLYDFDWSRGRYYFRIIGDVLFHVHTRATCYVTSNQSEITMAADNTQHSHFVLFREKRVLIYDLFRNALFFIDRNFIQLI